MSRLSAALLSFVLALTCAGTPAVVFFGEEAVREGQKLHALRSGLLRRLRRASRTRPLAVLMGDSTVLKDPEFGSYPLELQKSLADRAQLLVVDHVGLHFYHYYCLMGPVLERGPRLVVLVANPRMFYGRSSNDVWLDQLAPLIPTAELPRAATLPFYERGLGFPRLLMLRTTRWNPALRIYDIGRGLRVLFRTSPLWKELPALETTRTPELPSLLRAAWDRRIDPDTPMVHMMRATLRMAERRGHPVLVIGTPVPLHVLRQQLWFDEEDYRERLGVLRSTAEQNGAQYLDLHAALGPGEFRDNSGHFNATGTRRMTELVEPEIARLLLR